MTPSDSFASEEQRRQMELWAEERRQHVERLKDKEVFTTGEVALLVKVAPRTVVKWFDSGRLPGQRVGSSQRRQIPREELLHFLSEHGMPIPWESEE